jgi:hypothetical protein
MLGVKREKIFYAKYRSLYALSFVRAMEKKWARVTESDWAWEVVVKNSRKRMGAKISLQKILCKVQDYVRKGISKFGDL